MVRSRPPRRPRALGPSGRKAPRLAASVGLRTGLNAVESVLADRHERQARGVIGSPHFFVDEMRFFCPALDIDRINGHLCITPSCATFDAFIAERLAA